MLSPAIATQSFWLRTREPLLDDAAMHAAAFACLSDWWRNCAAVGIHVPQLGCNERRLHVASLSHAVWFYRPFRADGWLLL